MTTYAVGDIQGCLKPLQCLLEQVNFEPSRDRLWLCGDLVNRGPESLATLRFLYSIRDSVTAVLGNHDLHLLAVAWSGDKLKNKDTLQEILDAPDRDELLEWMRHFPLLHYDADLNFAMSHAGIPPVWTLDQALDLSRELEAVLQGPQLSEYLNHMYGNKPDRWNDALEGPARWRLVTNYFTRMRFCSADGRLELKCKLGPDSPPEGFAAWFRHPSPALQRTRLIFGHWASLEGKSNTPGLFALDTGCVWGRELTLLNLEDESLLHCDCPSG